MLPLVLMGMALMLSSEGFAQAVRHPFAVGASEGATGSTNALSTFILAQESSFYRMLTGAIRAVAESGAAWGLIGLSFAYGVFHAAGPGHGKAVIASYMLANERTFWRGIVISLAAAFLQGLVAIAIVGIAALVFHATAKHMTAASNVVEIASYAGMTALGAWLVTTKSTALFSLWRDKRAAGLDAAFAGARPVPTRASSGSAFVAEDCGRTHRHHQGCGHVHAIALDELDSGLDWRRALLTVLAAGSRPCSGAILVLVFALAQGVFLVGAFSVAAMSLGTAMTTGALASFAVFFKKIAERFAEAGSSPGTIALYLLETCAALVILGLGLTLLLASLTRAL